MYIGIYVYIYSIYSKATFIRFIIHVHHVLQHLSIHQSCFRNLMIACCISPFLWLQRSFFCFFDQIVGPSPDVSVVAFLLFISIHAGHPYQFFTFFLGQSLNKNESAHLISTSQVLHARQFPLTERLGKGM